MPVPLDIAPSELRVEHLGSGILGLGVRAPRLSWRLPDRVTRQEAYQIEINGKPSPRVVSDACVLVPWPGQPVASRQDVSWRVRVWSEQGESPWSPAGWFEAGLLEESDWSAHWIEPPGDDRQPLVLQKEFPLEGAPTRGTPLRDGSWHLRVLPQRSARGRSGTDSGVHQLSDPAAGPGLRRDGAPGPGVEPMGGRGVRWLVPGPTRYASSNGRVRRHAGISWSARNRRVDRVDRLGMDSRCGATGRGRPDRRTDRRPQPNGQGVAAGRGESRKSRTPSAGPPRHPSAGSSTSVPSRSRGSLPIGRWPTSARTSTVGCG